MVDVHDDQAINRWVNRVQSGKIVGVIALEGSQTIGYCNLHTNNLPWIAMSAKCACASQALTGAAGSAGLPLMRFSP
jgi:hypothetical protein